MMKKAYESPLAEVVKFEYKDQVVVASGGVLPGTCTTHRSHEIISGSGQTCTEQGSQNA
jgi:hypothetical protein